MAGKVRLSDDVSYWDEPVEHCSQGDLYEGVPLVHMSLASQIDETSGTRTRPSSDGPTAAPVGINADAVVLHYTCGFAAQPPGTRGYGHNFRLLAPLLSFRTLLDRGTPEKDLRTIQEHGRAAGYMYVTDPSPDLRFDGSPWFGDAALLLFRPSLVQQAVLDELPRSRRLSEPAQRILMALLVQQFTAEATPDPDGLAVPDRSDGWRVSTSP